MQGVIRSMGDHFVFRGATWQLRTAFPKHLPGWIYKHRSHEDPSRHRLVFYPHSFTWSNASLSLKNSNESADSYNDLLAGSKYLGLHSQARNWPKATCKEFEAYIYLRPLHRKDKFRYPNFLKNSRENRRDKRQETREKKSREEERG